MWLLTYKLYKYQKIFQKTLEKPEFRGNPKDNICKKRKPESISHRRTGNHISTHLFFKFQMQQITKIMINFEIFRKNRAETSE